MGTVDGGRIVVISRGGPGVGQLIELSCFLIRKQLGQFAFFNQREAVAGQHNSFRIKERSTLSQGITIELDGDPLREKLLAEFAAEKGTAFGETLPV